MKTKVSIVFLICMALTFPHSVLAEEAPEALITFAKKEFKILASNPIIVKAVKEENAKHKSLDSIKATDQKWQDTIGVDDFMRAMMESDCAKHLIALQKEMEFLDEIFVMDNQGANVAMTNKTSDYWQGDEDKFQKSFNKGKGGIDVGEVEFDESAQAYLVQISLPVIAIDAETKEETVIGAITIGINIDVFEKIYS